MTNTEDTYFAHPISPARRAGAVVENGVVTSKAYSIVATQARVAGISYA